MARVAARPDRSGVRPLDRRGRRGRAAPSRLRCPPTNVRSASTPGPGRLPPRSGRERSGSLLGRVPLGRLRRQRRLAGAVARRGGPGGAPAPRRRGLCAADRERGRRRRGGAVRAASGRAVGAAAASIQRLRALQLCVPDRPPPPLSARADRLHPLRLAAGDAGLGVGGVPRLRRDRAHGLSPVPRQRGARASALPARGGARGLRPRAGLLRLHPVGRGLAPSAGARGNRSRKPAATPRIFWPPCAARGPVWTLTSTALNRLPPRFVWWWLVANPELENTWTH